MLFWENLKRESEKKWFLLRHYFGGLVREIDRNKPKRRQSVDSGAVAGRDWEKQGQVGQNVRLVNDRTSASLTDRLTVRPRSTVLCRKKQDQKTGPNARPRKCIAMARWLSVLKVVNTLQTRPDTLHQRRGQLGRGSIAKTARNSEMLLTDEPADGPSDTARCRVACPRLKILRIYIYTFVHFFFFFCFL